jgi:hypothetical protein
MEDNRVIIYQNPYPVDSSDISEVNLQISTYLPHYVITKENGNMAGKNYPNILFINQTLA